MNITKRMPLLLQSLRQELQATEYHFLIVFGLSCLAFSVTNWIISASLTASAGAGILFLAASLMGTTMRPHDLIRPVKIALYAIAALCCFYTVIAAPYIPASEMETLQHTMPVPYYILNYG